MKQVKPKVFLIAHTAERIPGMAAWLTYLDGQEVFNHITGTSLEQLVELAARRYDNAFKLGPKLCKESKKFHANYLRQGHGSVLEHSSATFAFEDVSQVFTHGLVQHQLGCACYIAPMGLATGIVATFNMRALRHIIVQRTSPAAEVEIRQVFVEVGQIAKDTWPYLFQDFLLDDGSWICEYEKV